MIEVYAYQEVVEEIAQGETVTFILHPTVYVIAVRKNPQSEIIHVTYNVCVGAYSIGTFESEFPTLEKLLDCFDIAAHEEVFEVVGEP